ncbi:MAG: acylphosphatase [Desulfovibrio sp.]
MKTYHAVVDGLVQGVCFRAWTRDVARMLGLRGWVRNLRDGRVEVVAQGPKQALEEFASQLDLGSPLSRVSGVESSEREEDESYSSFEIRY